MANLIKLLRGQGFDYIDGPIRNHKVLQLWNKTNFDSITEFDLLENLFTSSVDLISYEDPALYVNYTSSVNYNFKLGLTALDVLLKSIGLGELGVEAKINNGKEILIKYDSAKTVNYAKGNLSNFFYDEKFDFKYTNNELLKQANRDNLILIGGILYAQNLEVSIKSTSDINANASAELADMVDGKLEFKLENSKELVMKADLGTTYPIAVKAFRLRFDKGRYISMNLVSDNRTLF